MARPNWLTWLRHGSRRTRPAGRRPALLGRMHDWLLEDRCMPSTGGPPYEFPANTPGYDSIGDVMFDGVTGQFEKTITITNNSPTQTIYAFLEGQNSRQAIAPYAGTGAFDPYDAANQEYRAYIGYTDGTKNYAGLPPLSSITIPVPLAFWDSGRISFSTDGANQFNSAPGAAAVGAPFYYHDFNTQAGFFCYIDPAHLDRLYFTPIYNSFDPNTGYMPTTASWKSPVELGLLKTGMEVNVPGNSKITVDPSHPEYVTLQQPATAALPTQQFVFTSAGNDTISPTDRYTSTGYSLTTPQGTSTNGAVMWYHALHAKLPNNDAPFQLTEFTFRGYFYDPKVNPTTGFQYLLGNDPGNGIDANDFDLADYDISFVDSINMPVAMAASNAGIPHPRSILPGGATESGNTVTITTPTPHGFSAGQRVTIGGYSGADAGYNGTYTILQTGLTATSFQYTNSTTGLAPSTTGGVATTFTAAPYGWVGSPQKLEDFQTALVNFTTPNPTGQNVNGLGQYFGGKGYPSYLVIDEGNLKLPSGQNIFLASPAGPSGLSDIQYVQTFPDNSFIQQPAYALTSAGTGPTQLSIGGDATHPTQGRYLGLSNNTDAYRYMLNLIVQSAAQGHPYTVTYNVGGVTKSAGQAVGPYYAADGTTLIGVKLSQDVPADATPNLGYDFSLPPTDYVVQSIASIWYSWANFYATQPNSKNWNAATNVPGTIGVGSNILTLTNATTGLVPGMAVTGSALPAGCVILAVGADNKTIRLSTAATGAGTTFNFAKPSVNSIVGYDPGGFTPLLPGFNFAADQATALAFAETVYLAMSAWSVSVPAGTPNACIPLLANIIGGNLNTDFLPNGNTNVTDFLTIKSKSLLRGVPDYTSSLYSDPGQWYPDPSLAAGGQPFNVYNLNPFVWFIHEKLGLGGYAFALDDDIGNVGAGGATHLDITVGGLNGVPNTDPYSPLSPWGVVTTRADPAPAKSSVLTNLTNPYIVYQLSQFDYPNNVLGTLVNGPGVQTGTTVQFTSIDQDHTDNTRLVLSRPLSSATTASTTFSFFGPVVFTGKVLGRGQPRDTIYLDNLEAYNTLLKLAPFSNIQVTGPGIPAGTTVTIKSLPKITVAGVYPVELTSNLQSGLVSQPGASYGYRFGNPVVGTIRDEGFEWAVVKGLVNDLNHGAQVSQNTRDWTFIDGNANLQWYAGIAYNTSPFLVGNPPAPQGVQVGFITGTSSISQTLTLAAGKYTLSFRAAQRANQQLAQSLNVKVGPVGGQSVVVGKNLTPAGKTYALTTLSFTVTTAGSYTITFEGVRNADSTVLLDAITCVLSPK